LKESKAWFTEKYREFKFKSTNYGFIYLLEIINELTIKNAMFPQDAKLEDFVVFTNLLAINGRRLRRIPRRGRDAR
jgi:hypothetical protein